MISQRTLELALVSLLNVQEEGKERGTRYPDAVDMYKESRGVDELTYAIQEIRNKLDDVKPKQGMDLVIWHIEQVQSNCNGCTECMQVDCIVMSTMLAFQSAGYKVKTDPAVRVLYEAYKDLNEMGYGDPGSLECIDD